MNKRGNELTAQEQQQQEKERQALLADVAIHVMPESFAAKNATVKEAPKPIVKPALPPSPPPAPKPVSTVPVKPKSNAPWILLGAGMVVIAVLGVGGYFVLQAPEQPIVQVTNDADGDGIEDDRDNCPNDANASQSDIDRDGIGDVCDPVDDREPEVLVPGPGVDTDSDGLTDVEEALYGTDSRNPDSDGDSFLDGNEVFHGYSPLGTAPQTLLDTGAVEIFAASDGTFSFTYPTSWRVMETVNPETGLVQEIVLQTNTSAEFRIRVLTGIDESSFDGYQETLTKEGYLMYLDNSKLQAAVVVGEGYGYSFRYELGNDAMIDFLQTFQMLINSFVTL